LYAHGFRIYFTPLPGFFSPFPHGTGSLSVDYEYLALEDGPPIFRQDFSCPALLVVRLVSPSRFRVRGYHPLWPPFPKRSTIQSTITYKAHPISLATTLGISVDFFSCSYLDVSVRRVRFAYLCIQYAMTYKGRVSPFGNLRIKACLLAPRSLSQATTSFVACNRQGIHHVHLFACPYNVGLCMRTENVINTRISAYYICDTTNFLP
jgi:hypothetical protein